jgi:UDP-sugar diphosphatase
MAVEHDNVAILIYHTEKKQILLVKQFRPPVFIHNVRTKDENKGKVLESIDWSHYPIHVGETLELCAGLMVSKDINSIILSTIF